MKIRNVILVIMALLVNVVNLESDFEKYINLKIHDVPSINPNDLPKEFSHNAFIVIDQFIKKNQISEL